MAAESGIAETPARLARGEMVEQSDELIFAVFVRSLTPEQQSALAGVMELMGKDEAFRWF